MTHNRWFWATLYMATLFGALLASRVVAHVYPPTVQAPAQPAPTHAHHHAQKAPAVQSLDPALPTYTYGGNRQ